MISEVPVEPKGRVDFKERKITDVKCSSWPSYIKIRGFSDSSAGKESACKAGDPGSIPGSGRSPREGIGYPIQSSWASLVAQLGKNLPAMPETWVQSYLALIPGLGRFPGEGKGYPLQYSVLKNSKSMDLQRVRHN